MKRRAIAVADLRTLGEAILGGRDPVHPRARPMPDRASYGWREGAQTGSWDHARGSQATRWSHTGTARPNT